MNLVQLMMVDQAALALNAFKGGDLPRYELHRANARRLADHLALQEAQEQRRVDQRWTRRVEPPLLAPGVIDKGEDDADFLRQENALFAMVRIVLPYIAAFAAVALLVGRARGWI